MFLTDAKDARSWIEDSNRFRHDAELYLKQIEFYRTGSGLVEKSLNYEIDSLTLDEYMKRTMFRDITEWCERMINDSSNYWTTSTLLKKKYAP